MRKVGNYEYKEEAERIILSLVTQQPQTIMDITRIARTQFFAKIHPITVKRLLEKLKNDGKIRGKELGRCRTYYL